jgi:CheY-like chemotaxis protein
VTGEELIKNLESDQSDLYLLDYQLHGINGIELIPHIKEKYPDIPVALVTASSQKTTFEEAESNGADRIILKPYSTVDVLHVVEEMLG